MLSECSWVKVAPEIWRGAGKDNLLNLAKGQIWQFIRHLKRILLEMWTNLECGESKTQEGDIDVLNLSYDPYT